MSARRATATRSRRKTTEDVALEDVATRLHSLSIHLLRRVWARDGEMGLSRARASALSVLVFRGSMTMTELAAAEHVTTATMSRLVSAMEAEGWIERVPHPSDARAATLRATKTARTVMEKGRQRRVDAMSDILRGLKTGELAVVSRAVTALERTLAVQSAPPG